MNIKRILLSCMVMGCLAASAQEAPEAKTEYEFHPHWYLQIQPAGLQYTLGEVDYKDLLSYNFQVGAGYQLNHVVGLRLAINAFQSRAGGVVDTNGTEKHWKWNYIAPMIDVTANLSDVFYGFNPKRLFNVSVYAGVGVNISWHNNNALSIASDYDNYLGYLWDGTHARVAGHAGMIFDFRVCDAVSIGLEAQATTLNDRYNSKKSSNSDWYFNTLLGVRINLGKTYTKKQRELPPLPQERVVEKVVEKIVEVPVEQEVVREVVADPTRCELFFTLSNTEIVSQDNKDKIRHLAEYMEKAPDTKVTITGYADKGTGNAETNMRLSERRAESVANILKSDYGIDASRINIVAKGDTEQPFGIDVQNRACICEVE